MGKLNRSSAFWVQYAILPIIAIAQCLIILSFMTAIVTVITLSRLKVRIAK